MKKLLSTFIILFIGLISFCSSQYSISDGELQNYSFSRGSNLKLNFPSNTNCFYSTDSNSLVYIKYNSVELQQLTTGYYCFLDSSLVYYRKVNVGTTSTNLIFFNGFYSTTCNCTVCEECEECNECPTIDSQYCQENNLCPSTGTGGDCPIYTGDGNWSALLINDEQYNSAGIINVSIPSDYGFDYNNDGEQVDLTVEGYNVDTDYIEGIISNQTTKPNQTDLNNIITGVIPLFVPGLVIILFIYFIFKFLKKIF